MPTELTATLQLAVTAAHQTFHCINRLAEMLEVHFVIPHNPVQRYNVDHLDPVITALVIGMDVRSIDLLTCDTFLELLNRRRDEPRQCRCARCNWTFTVDVPEGGDPEVYARARWFCPHCGHGSAAEFGHPRTSE